MTTSMDLDSETGQKPAHTGRSKANALRESSAQGVGEMQDYALAAEVRERLRQGRERVHSAASVRTALGLEH